jgi:adenylate kinase
MSTEKDFIFILGGPGSGKGTQALWIAKHYGIGYLSTGDLLRNAVKKLTNPKDISEEELTKLRDLDATMRSGGLVEDAIVLSLMKETMQNGKEKHWFIDGFPRKVSQIDLFKQEIGDATKCLYIKVSDEVLTERIIKRGETSGRADDNAEAVKKRIETYHAESEPVIEHYQKEGKVIEIDGERSVELVRNDCIEKIKSVWSDIVEQDPEQLANDGKESKCCLLI